MVFGECPYCGSNVVNVMPERSPAYTNPTCPGCGKTYWVYLTRVEECWAATEEDFLKKYRVNYDTGKITARSDIK